MNKSRYPGLEIPEDMRQQQREWRMQRVLWPILYAMLLAIAIGFLGKGPVSHAEVGEAGNDLHMKYQRFLRYRAPDKLELEVRAGAETVEITFDKQYVSNIEIEKIMPTPERVVSGADTTVFVFNARGTTRLQAQFYFKPEKIGSLEGRIALKDHAPQSFRQFVYP
jgi:hypothetical protein